VTERLLDGSADEILARMANPEDPASGGVAAASACAMAAALVTMTARASVDEWTDAAGVAAQAHLLQGRARALTQTASETFAAARGALRPIGGAGAATALGPALDAAADVPLRVCTTAADIGALAALAAENANADVRPDAVVAAGLALAAAQGAAHLVAINLTVTDEDPRRKDAEQAVLAARHACAIALAAG
jgi:formiminotetrahydrofolate cyclodeaminase